MKDFPLIRSVRAAIVGTALLALPVLAMAASPLTAIYLGLYALYLLPTALCVAGMVCGLAPMLLGLAATLAALFHVGGLLGLELGCAYLLPIVILFMTLVRLRTRFFAACGGMILAHVAGLTIAYLLAQHWAGGALYTVAGDLVANAVDEWEMGDMLLYQFYSTGLIGLPSDLADSALLPVLGGYVLSPAARADLLLSLRSLINSLLAAFVPSLIGGQSVLGGVACLYFPMRLGFVAAERRAFRSSGDQGYTETEDGKKTVDFPDLSMPSLALWHIPRGMGWKVGVALIAGSLLRSGTTAAAAIAGIVLYSAASALFTIQGVATINFMQKAKGTRLGWRIVVPLLLALLSVLSLVGIFDQITNIRGLRKPRQPKEE